uniref:Uncharacterized protein n=1 Tax=Picea glauca TaxID=3330 RepID=A0A124GMG1_PICGL|nr:hypothetical protein ABT39_MTgene2393 [Picea glauca]QHR88978.1 hypothetical protein Q903MT_gene2997 [Picea sitchensis]
MILEDLEIKPSPEHPKRDDWLTSRTASLPSCPSSCPPSPRRHSSSNLFCIT